MTLDPSTQQRSSPETIRALADELKRSFGDRVSSSDAIRTQHGNTLTWGQNVPPDLVVFAESTQEVAAIIRLAANRRVPVIAYGTGTSLEGHLNAPLGGVCIDLSRMDRIVAVRPQDLDCTVEAGVTRHALNHHLRDMGLFFPIDPGADASIGGMTATRASGTNAVRYGTMREAVLSLTAVLANGEIIRTSSRARKSSTGYDLTRLLIGSEGTLGIITEITLRLHGIPEAISSGICSFPSVKQACDAAITAIQWGIPLARVELLDDMQVKACNLYSGLDLPETPLLLLEFHGSPEAVHEQSERFGAIAADCGGGTFDWVTKPEERSRLWQARHDAHWASKGLRPGADAVVTDVCVPISRLAECVEATQRDLAENDFVATIVGHVGDGNFHVQLMVDHQDSRESAALTAFVDRLVQRAIDMDGTASGEHGVGQMKRKYMIAEHGAETVDAMRAIKSALDPLGILNPGKILPQIP